MFVPSVTGGRWITADGDVAVSDGFARHAGIAVGDTLEVELASGPHTYRVVGLVDDKARAVYGTLGRFAADLGAPGHSNVVWASTQDPGLDLGAATDTVTAAEADAEGNAGRNAIVAIFGALGAIVATVSALALAWTLAVDLYERRHELAALRAIGARRPVLRGLLVRELAPLTLLGLGLGAVGGWAATKGIIASFENANAVDIGTVYAASLLPVISLATVVGAYLLVRLAVRGALRRPLAATLRAV
jgi:putative ABC transport system permease protein